MKLALVLSILLLSTAARADALIKPIKPGQISCVVKGKQGWCDLPSSVTGYFDLTKVLTDSDEAKKNAVDQKADIAAKQAEVTAAEEAAKKLDATCAKDPQHGIVYMETGKHEVKVCDDASDKHTQANALANRYVNRDIPQRREADAQRLIDRVTRILPGLAKAQHLAAILPQAGAFYADPSVDQTAEVLRRLNAGDGKDPVATAADVARLKADNIAKDAEIARLTALTKPVAPSVPPPPPVAPQPIASKGTK